MKNILLFAIIALMALSCKKDIQPKVMQVYEIRCKEGYKYVDSIKVPLSQSELDQMYEDIKNANWGYKNRICTEFLKDTVYY